jgi:hypothetical protein
MEEKKDAIKFKLDQPVKGKFNFGEFPEPLSGESTGKDGEKFEWFMYKFVDESGEEKVFFPSKGLQRTLSESGPLNGRNFTITKVLLKDENGNIQENDKGQPILTFDVVFNEPDVEFKPAGETTTPVDLSEM